MYYLYVDYLTSYHTDNYTILQYLNFRREECECEKLQQQNNLLSRLLVNKSILAIRAI